MLRERNGIPVVMAVPEPDAQPGCSKIRVHAAGLQPTDIMRARGHYKVPELPYIVGGEGVGDLNGSRVYFGHSIKSSGAFAQWTIVPDEEIWPLDDIIDGAQAIALGIAGTGALLPLEEAKIQAGESVLILGATGPLGQIALQVARAMGAGSVTAAARGLPGLKRLAERGIADQIVQLGLGNDESALKQASRAGFNVVLDCVYGPPAEAALRATADGARMMSIGVGAGNEVTLSLKDLSRRSIHGVGTGHRPAQERRAAFERLLAMASEGRIAVDIAAFTLDETIEAWNAQLGSPGGKVVVAIGAPDLK